jgi:hypothetical protein
VTSRLCWLISILAYAMAFLLSVQHHIMALNLEGASEAMAGKGSFTAAQPCLLRPLRVCAVLCCLQVPHLV